jgi:hypothetical protein
MTLHRSIILSVLSLLVSASVFAHGGHKHSFLGTVKMLHADRVVVTTTDQSEVTFVLTDRTRFSKGGSAATKKDLKNGVRVSVHVENDGKTATAIKIAATEGNE